MLAVDLGPGVRAGFTTRTGGVSRVPYDALNLGAGVADEPSDVARNRGLVAGWVGAPVAFGTQVHGRAVAVVRTPADADDLLASVGEVDALVGAGPGVAVGVLVADCVPVLLADAEAGLVAAVHAGRRGLVAGVVEAAVDALVAEGAQPDRLRAAVGPCIAGRSYEVPADLRDEVAAAVPETAATTSWGTPALDLPAGVAAVLRRTGVRDVARADRDTYTDADLFSFRRDGTTGRFAGVVRAPG
ncbi:peptidoglycan editing factor PgeF [Cellulomonas fimi]|nr:peptidoglycan editing factor PgeF [Cellulomonas fimi]